MDIKNAVAVAKVADRALRRRAWIGYDAYVYISPGPYPPINELSFRNVNWSRDERSIPYTPHVSDLLGDDWELDQRFTFNGAKVAEPVALSAANVTDQDVQSVSFIVGLSPGAWDQVNARELVAAAFNVINKRLNEEPQ